jgi:hypothetical protein
MIWILGHRIVPSAPGEKEEMAVLEHWLRTVVRQSRVPRRILIAYRDGRYWKS